jgi:hypothetical protein
MPPTVPHRPRPAVRRAIIAIPFIAALLIAARLNSGPIRSGADATHPGFALRDETAQAGIHFVHHRPSFDPRIAGIEPHVAGLGASVSVADVDGDGKPDLYFTDSRFGYPNALYHNKGDGTFEDVAIPTGVAVDEAGRARGAMGAAWADTKNGPGFAVAIGNFSNELKSLYWTDTGEVFLDESPKSGVGPSSFLDLTFGVLFLDADLDGRMDLVLANGHVEPTVQEVQKDVSYRQAPMLYRNAGGGRFTPLGERSGDLARPLVARGSAFADLDGDGDLDLVIVENGGPARVYLNPTNAPNRSVRLRLVGTDKSNRDAVGARVTAKTGDRTLTQQVSGGQSYLSASEKTLTFGLGDAPKIDTLEIRWPDGASQTLRDVPGGARLRVVEGATP